MCKKYCDEKNKGFWVSRKMRYHKKYFGSEYVFKNSSLNKKI